MKITPAATILAGLFNLAIALGVGRFAYTALLPAMQSAFPFSDTIAGSLASMNNVGYLVGTVVCQKMMPEKWKVRVFRLALMVCVSSTIAVGMTEQILLWQGFRLIGGVASGILFVLGSALVVDSVQKHILPYATLMYCGVGLGIALSGALTPFFIHYAGVMDAWIGLGIVCIPMAIYCWVVLNPSPSNNEPSVQPKTSQARVHNSRFFPWFVAAYFFEAFGYISSATFIVSFLQGAGDGISGTTPWVITGLAAASSIPIVSLCLRQLAPLKILVAMYGIQCIGILLPVYFQSTTFAIVGAILFGGTFMGIAAHSIYIGTTLYPERRQWIIGILASAYGGGQIFGPMATGIIADHVGGFAPALILSAASVALGGMLLVIGGLRSKGFQASAIA